MVLVLPAMLVMLTLYGVLNARLLALAPVGVAAVGGVLAFVAIDPVAYFFAGQDLAVGYASNFIFTQISDALDNGLIGGGVGTSTGSARYALNGATIDDRLQYLYESYFAKAAAELGWIGFAAIVVLFIVIAWRVAVTAQANYRHPENAIVAPVAVYLAYNLIMSFKAFVLDTDPGNIFFWLLLGLMVGVDRLRRGAVASGDQSIFVQDEADAYDPA